MSALILTNQQVQAASFSVTTTTDGGAGSLRDAITQANANPGADVINVPAGTYTISLAGADEDSNATGDFDITGDTTIVGAGAGLTVIDGADLDRVFDVQSGSTVFEGVTITNGNVGSGSGGNIMKRTSANLTIQDSVVSAGYARVGGGIRATSGTVTILRSELINNQVVSIPGNGSSASAASINSTFTMSDSLVAGNSAGDGNGALVTGSDSTITNSTFTGNSGSRTLMVEVSSGTRVINLRHLTIANNVDPNLILGVALFVNVSSPASATVTVEGSLFQDNLSNSVERNCAISQLGVISSGGNNIADDASCTTFVQSGDQLDNDSTTLGALADNGGPTRTLALVAGSSAIDAAGSCGAVTATDQRGISRPQGTACDVGAFEVEVEVEPTSTTSTTTSTTLASTTTSTIATTTSSTSTTTANTSTSTTLSNSGAGTTTTIRRTLPSTGTDPSNSIWLAMLLFSLGGLLVMATRRIAR